MDEKAAHELASVQGHGFVLIRLLAAIVLALEGDATLIAGNQPAVADGDPMGVSRQVGKYGLRPGERTLGIDHPFCLA